MAWALAMNSMNSKTPSTMKPAIIPSFVTRGWAVFRQQGKTLAVGAYEHCPLEVRQDEIASPNAAHTSGRQPAIHDFTYQDYAPTWEEIQRVYPSVGNAGLDEERSSTAVLLHPRRRTAVGPSTLFVACG